MWYPNHQLENLMDIQIIVVFCLYADMLKSLHHYEDRQCRMNGAEVMTSTIVAMPVFKGYFCLTADICLNKAIPQRKSN